MSVRNCKLFARKFLDLSLWLKEKCEILNAISFKELYLGEKIPRRMWRIWKGSRTSQNIWVICLEEGMVWKSIEWYKVEKRAGREKRICREEGRKKRTEGRNDRRKNGRKKGRRNKINGWTGGRKKEWWKEMGAIREVVTTGRILNFLKFTLLLLHGNAKRSSVEKNGSWIPYYV